MNEVDSGVLLNVVRAMVAEMRRRREDEIAIELDDSLERELGFDSLARTELSRRLEAKFGIVLSETHLFAAETPRDLLNAISARGERPVRITEPAALAGRATMEKPPDTTATLLDALEWHVEQHRDRIHIHVYGDADEPEDISYGALLEGARRVAAGLVGRGVEPGNSVALMLPTGKEYFFTLYGILLAGAVPVPLYPPTRWSQLEDHLKRQRGILDNSNATHLVTFSEVKRLVRSLGAGIVTAAELAEETGPGPRHPARTEETALLQYTSGSTGNPKGVVLTHANLLANLRAMGKALHVTSADVFVSWLPLYHDMGLIGASLGTMYFAVPLALMSPLAFLAKPSRWLHMIHRHRATLSASPNFGYELCVTKVGDDELEGLDLSSWRAALNGAEPVSPGTISRFTEKYSRYGFRAEAMTPVYGLAESSLGVTFPQPIGQRPVIDNGVVGCGRPLPAHEIRIVDEAERELPDRRPGRLEFRGPSASDGYFQNPEATRRLVRGEWRDTGDLAYIAGGELFVTGRSKDVIIRAGRNIHPHQVEEAIGTISGVRKGCVALFGATDQKAGTERLVVVAERRSAEDDERMKTEIASAVIDHIGSPPDEILLAAPHTVPKTSSGKIRRSSARELYERGILGKKHSLWRTAPLLIAARTAGFFSRIRESAYNVFIWSICGLVAVPGWLLVAGLPTLSARWRAVKIIVSMILRIARIPVRVDHRERLASDRRTVLVVNHASYADIAVLVSILPRPVSFAAKKEFLDHFITRIFLRRLGAVFVERFDPERGRADTNAVIDRVKNGVSLGVFPEGTFSRGPGLLPFRMGAFVTSAETSTPVVPVAISGTRSVLRGSQWFFRRHPVRVNVGDAIMPEGADWPAALKLRDEARTFILRETGEPDLEI